MTITPQRAAWAAACVICVTTACDVPVLPQWDTSWNVPLPSQAIPLPPVPIPNNTSITDSFPTQQQALDESIGELLKNAADTGSVIVELTKRQTLALSGSFTLSLATSLAALGSAGPNRIDLPFSFAANAGLVSQSAPGVDLSLLRGAADAGGTLFVRFQGTLSNNSGGTVTPNPGETIAVKLSLITLIHSSR